MSLRSTSAVVLGAILLLLGGALVITGRSSDSDLPGDVDTVVEWLEDRDHVGWVETTNDDSLRTGLVVHVAKGADDSEVWDLVDDFQGARTIHNARADIDYTIDVDGFVAHLATHAPSGDEPRAENDGDLVRALWLRADGRAISVGAGDAISTSVRVVAPAPDVAQLALDLDDLGVDTGDSIRVEAPDRSVGIQWTTRLDFGLDTAAVKELVALQERFPGTRGWVEGVAFESSSGIVFSPDDLSLEVLRRDLDRLVPRRTGDRRLSVGWGVLLADHDQFRDQSADAETRRAYVALSRIRGVVGSSEIDVVVTDLEGFRAARRVLRAHPKAWLDTIGYGPAPSWFLGHDRPLVFETDATPRPRVLAAYEQVIALEEVVQFAPASGRIQVTPGIDDPDLRIVLEQMKALVKPTAVINVSVFDVAVGSDGWRGDIELAPEGAATLGEQIAPRPSTDALMERIAKLWAATRIS